MEGIDGMQGFKHSPGRIILIVLSTLFFANTLFFNYLSAAGQGLGGVFLNTTGGISNKYQHQIVPAGWTFSIWGAIYLWQAIWIVYAWTTVCRKSASGYLYVSPGHMPPAMYGVWILNMALNVSWLILWDREMIIVSLCVIALMPFTLYICIGISIWGVNKSSDYLSKSGNAVDIWLTRFTVQNGMAFYATWTTLATLLNFTSVLIYKANVENSIASTISLSIVTAEIVVYFTLDMTVLDRFTRYLFSPYIVCIVALSGVHSRNWNPELRNSIFNAVLIGVACVCCLAKIIVMFYRHLTKPFNAIAITV
ncbi:unnamed protein product [Owenia fusiformis]|uniref:Uncharacterized protein n=1 Tax=Owenia fusiformis TaxID=6347 RepID=A0A8S4N1T5_OWEFU|nr:unnamed protein product [Owenia fusiformis]